jgi:deoxyguanosine kinase
MVNKFIILEGNIGSGKTTLANKLAVDFNAKLILEQFEDNPFLPKFYENPRQHAFPLELSFLAERYNQMKEISLSQDIFQPILIADYFLYKSLIFSKANLSEDEYALYYKLFNIMYDRMHKPDLLVYLYVDIPRLKQNIQKRGREYEQNISEQYLQAIQSGYLSYLKVINDFPVLVLDANDLDFVESPKDYEKIKNFLKISYPKGVTYENIEK